MSSANLAILAEGMRKRFKQTQALNGFDLAVPEGTICGLLGPNGAGKTTAVRIFATLLQLDGGQAEVAGLDVATRAAAIRTRIGFTGQHATVDEILTGRENLMMWARLYHLDRPTARRRSDDLLDRFGLADAAGKQVKHYSGGMRRRLDMAASLIQRPRVLFLDEPTTGLDPRNRNDAWDAIRRLVRDGTTVLLTTQYLEEADQLADQIVVIDSGAAIATGTPDDLKSQIGGDRIDVVLRDVENVPEAARIVARIGGSTPEVALDTRRVSAPVANRVAALTGIVQALAVAGIEAEDIALRRPTLDEVFLRLTGQAQPHHEEVAA